MRNADINFLCRNCTQELQNKLRIIKDMRPDFLKNLIFLEIKDKSLVELKEEYDIKIVLYLRCANRHFGLFVKNTLFDKRGGYKDIVLENVINNDQSVLIKDHSYPTLVDNNLSEVNNNLTSSSLQETNVNFMKNMDHKINQLGMMHLHNMKHMSKMRRNFLIVLLVLIVLVAAGLAGGLGFYFTISKEVANAVNNQNVNRVDLSEGVPNLELGIIPDNQAATILSALKTSNQKVVINDLFLKDVSATQATVVAKSASGHYNYNSRVTVKFLATKLTLQTHLQNQIISDKVRDDNQENDILAGLKKENPLLVLGELSVPVEKIIDYQADIVVKANSKIYVPNDRISVYFNTSNQHLISQDLYESNLGNIHDKNSYTLLKILRDKNPTLKTSDIELTEITNTSALVVAKKTGSYFSGDQVKIYYQVYNPNIGVIINEYPRAYKDVISDSINIDENYSLLVGHQIMRFDLSTKEITKIEQLKKINDFIYTIVSIQKNCDFIGTEKGEIYEINNEGLIGDKIIDAGQIDGEITSMIKITQNKLWVLTWSGSLYELNFIFDPNGKVKYDLKQLKNKAFIYGHFMLKVSEDNILIIAANRSIYQLNNQGIIENKLINTSFQIFSLLKLQDDTILAVSGEIVQNSLAEIYQLNDDGSTKLKVDQPLTKNFTENVYNLMQVHNGEVFTFGEKIYELSNH